jgi:hypothetical protein
VTGHTTVDPGWIHEQFSVTASGSSTTLGFVSTSSGYAAVILDNVSVAEAPPEVPTQSAWSLALLAGLAVLGPALR